MYKPCGFIVQGVVAALLIFAAPAHAQEEEEPDLVAEPQVLDNELAQDLALIFQRHPTAFPSTLRGQVLDGRVTLMGTVQDLQQKLAAETLAREVPGVLAVDNQTVIEDDAGVTDVGLAAKVTRDLRLSPYLRRGAFKVYCTNRVIRMDGVVGSVFEKAHAQDIVSRAANVQGIDNRLRVVERNPTPPDDVLADRIHYNFRWSPFVDGDKVKFSVSRGLVTLTGTARSHLEYLAAESNVLKAGARGVKNNLVITSGPVAGQR